MYGRKSTIPGKLPHNRTSKALQSFRQLLESASSQNSSRESIHSSTPRTTITSKRPHSTFTSPAVSAAFEQSSNASSLSPSPSPSPPAVQTRAVKQANNESKRARVGVEVKGRQPLAFHNTTSVHPEVRRDTGVTTAASKKGKNALRPITRKIPANGIPLPAEGRVPLHQALGKVISNARRLQGFGGSWPLKGKEIRLDRPDEDEYPEETTEIIEDYTIQPDASSSSPAPEVQEPDETVNSTPGPTRLPDVAYDTVGNADPNSWGEPAPSLPRLQNETSHEAGISIAQELNHVDQSTAYFQEFTTGGNSHTPDRLGDPSRGPPRSTDLPAPSSSPSSTAGGRILPRTLFPGEDVYAPGIVAFPTPPSAQQRIHQSDIPEISVTLPTGSAWSPEHGSTVERSVGQDADVDSVSSKTPTKKSQSNVVAVDMFLCLAFGDQNVSSEGRYYKHVLPSRCIPRFRALSKPIPESPIAKVLVSQNSLSEGGLFENGYLGPGRRGFWEIPLIGPSLSLENCSQGIILGLATSVPYISTRTGMVVWTLQRLRYLLDRMQDLAKLGKFGVVTISTAGDRGSHSLEVNCQSSMALMMRTVFSELACFVDADGNETCEAASAARNQGDHGTYGYKWLSADSGIGLVWWDEIERTPVLIA